MHVLLNYQLIVKLFLEFFKGNLNSKNLKYLPLLVILSAIICNIYPIVKPNVRYLLFIKLTLKQNNRVPSHLCVNILCGDSLPRTVIIENRINPLVSNFMNF